MIHVIAYIDPGTGSIVLQAVAGTVLGVSYAVRHRIKAVVGKFRRAPQHTEETDKS